MVVIGGAAVFFSGGTATPIVVNVAIGTGNTIIATSGTAAAVAAGSTATAGGAAAAIGTTSAIAATGTGIAGGSAATGAITAGACLGPIGWIALGAEETTKCVSWNCWKPILRETSSVPSRSMLISDIVCNEAVLVDSVAIVSIVDFRIEVTNKWGDKFLIAPVILPGGVVAAHATVL